MGKHRRNRKLPNKCRCPSLNLNQIICLIFSIIITLNITFGSLIFDRHSYGTLMRSRRKYAAQYKDSVFIDPSTCVPKKFSKTCHSSNCDLYDDLATMVRKLAVEHSICMLLDSGSLLGAHRNWGYMEWDKDTDFAVFSTNTTAIETVLEEMKVDWHYTGKEIDGNKGRGKGFGYHINIKHSKQYIDLWLWSRVSEDKVGCVGINNGCEWWYLSNWKQKPPEYDIQDYSTTQLVPFGQWMLPAPINGIKILNQKYGNDWKTKCGGWQKGDRLCNQLYRSHPFVFTLNVTNGIEWKGLKLDGTLLEIGSMNQNGIYEYREKGVEESEEEKMDVDLKKRRTILSYALNSLYRMKQEKEAYKAKEAKERGKKTVQEAKENEDESRCCSVWTDGDNVVHYPRDPNWLSTDNMSPYTSSHDLRQHWKEDMAAYLDTNPNHVVLWNTGPLEFIEEISNIVTGVVIGNETVLAEHLKLREREQKADPNNDGSIGRPVHLGDSLYMQRCLEKLAKRHPKIISVKDFGSITKAGLWLSTYGSGKSWFIEHRSTD